MHLVPGDYSMSSWNPISDDDFFTLFAEQYDELSSDQRELFDQYRVSPWKAVIRRSEEAGDECVFVVAQSNDGVLYFDDVKYEFNFSAIDKPGPITNRGGSQNPQKGAVIECFPPL